MHLSCRVTEDKLKKTLFLIILLSSLSLFAAKPVFYFFHSENCPHCVHAKPFIEKLEKKYPQVAFKKMEVSRNLNNRDIYKEKVLKLKIEKAGVPLFVINKKYVIGFNKSYEKKIEEIIKSSLKK